MWKHPMPILRGHGVPTPHTTAVHCDFQIYLGHNRGQQDLTTATLGHCGCTKPKVRLPTRHLTQIDDKIWQWYIHEMCESGKGPELVRGYNLLLASASGGLCSGWTATDFDQWWLLLMKKLLIMTMMMVIVALLCFSLLLVVVVMVDCCVCVCFMSASPMWV